MDLQLIEGINRAYSARTDPIVFALTGRTGSGCTTAATILSKEFNEISLIDNDLEDAESRKLGIAIEYARTKWIPFAPVTVSSVIFSFLLHEEPKEVIKFLIDQKISQKGRDEFEGHLSKLMQDARFDAYKRTIQSIAEPNDKANAWEFFIQEIHTRAQQTKRVLGSDYPSLFQKLGDNVRYSGAPMDSTVHPDRLFSLMERVSSLVDCSISFQRLILKQPSRVVIDAIRNPLELVHLRRYIAGLYVVAITTEDEVRRVRLMESGLNRRDVDRLDEKEYPAAKHLQDYASFVSQNLKDCIQKSDIFVANPGLPAKFASSVREMNTQLVRYVALALRPGLITPTRDERCMQIAFVAKLNSGCISRQVGAVVADQGYSIHAIGWNDTPKGQTPCLLRNVSDLLGGQDDISFSEYEKTDTKLRGHLETKFATRATLSQQEGLQCPYCFKDAYNAVMRDKNQVHTRSLHAEENAFLQAAKRGSAAISGGILYTTASPCELCSKKAYQLAIKEIVYVDPYPGISTTHVLRSGAEDSQPQLRLFSGAVGSAYHRLYEALLSIKDEYAARLGSATNVTQVAGIAQSDS